MNIKNTLDLGCQNHQLDAASFSAKINEFKGTLSDVKMYFQQLQKFFGKIEKILDICKKNKQQEPKQNDIDRVNDEDKNTREFYDIFNKNSSGKELKEFNSLFVSIRLQLLQQVREILNVSDVKERNRNLKEIESDCSLVLRFVKDYWDQIVKTEVFIKRNLSKIKEKTLNNDVSNWNDQVSEVYKNIEALCKNANDGVKSRDVSVFVKNFNKFSDNLLKSVFTT